MLFALSFFFISGLISQSPAESRFFSPFAKFKGVFAHKNSLKEKGFHQWGNRSFPSFGLSKEHQIPKGVRSSNMAYLEEVGSCRFDTNPNFNKKDPFGWVAQGKKSVVLFSFDGGGVRGSIIANLIAHIEKKFGRPITEIGDYFAGTSAGSIVAGTLVVPDQRGNQKYSGGDALIMSDKLSQYVFRNTRFRKFRTGNIANKFGLTGSLYSAKPLENALWGIYQNTRMKDTVKPVFISSFDGNSGEGISFSTLEANRNPYMNIPLWKAVRGSTAAPIYFKPMRVSLCSEGHRIKHLALQDGAVGMYSPELGALNEILQHYPDMKIIVVSISTGHVPVNKLTKGGWKQGGLPQVLDPFIGGMFSEQKRMIEQTIQTLEQKYSIERFRIEFPLKSDKLADASAENLKDLRERSEEIKEKATVWANSGVPDKKNPTFVLADAIQAISDEKGIPIVGEDSNTPYHGRHGSSGKGYSSCKVTGILKNVNRYHTGVSITYKGLNERWGTRKGWFKLGDIRKGQCSIDGVPIRCSVQALDPSANRIKINLEVDKRVVSDCSQNTVIQIKGYAKNKWKRLYGNSKPLTFSWNGQKGNHFFAGDWERRSTMVQAPVFWKLGYLGPEGRNTFQKPSQRKRGQGFRNLLSKFRPRAMTQQANHPYR